MNKYIPLNVKWPSQTPQISNSGPHGRTVLQLKHYWYQIKQRFLEHVDPTECKMAHARQIVCYIGPTRHSRYSILDPPKELELAQTL